MKNPRIKRHYSIVAHSSDHVELRYGVWNPVSFSLQDESAKGVLHRLLFGLDGTKSIAALAKQEGVPREEAEALVDHLLQLGVLEDGPTNALDHYLENLIPGGQRVDASARPMRLVVLGDAHLGRLFHAQLEATQTDIIVDVVADDDERVRKLASSDVEWLHNGLRFEHELPRFEPWRDSHVVCLQRQINPLLFRALNRVSLALGFSWLHAAFDGPFLFIGPTVVPRRVACFTCFETRVLMNLREGESYLRYKRALTEGRARSGMLPVEGILGSMLASHVAWEALSYAVTRNSFTVGKVLALYLPTMEFSFNEILRVAACPDCGSLPERDDSELYFDLRSVLEQLSAK
jgi:bacteriocin biosynthesis cyclodehydratase domain-containing protein